MGKNKKKSDDKKAALQARKEAKAGKAARKRLQKEAKLRNDAVSGETGAENDQTLDQLLDLYRQQDIEVSTTVLEPLDSFPFPRANHSLVCCDDKSGHLYMFGGEYFDGVVNVIVDELLRWDPVKDDWRKLITPSPKPSPRCAHSCVYYRKALYMMGGEFATGDKYSHYRDIWKFDIQTLKWEEIRPRGTGSAFTARSGHVSFLWKHYMVTFGGFYETQNDPKWFNDVCVLDLQTHVWLDIPHSKLTSRPEERSACNVGVFADCAIIHGGYSKLRNPTAKAESKTHNDAWILHLEPILQGQPPTWERLSPRGKSQSPQNRSGTSSVTYKNRMLVFGGVTDEEELHHKVSSVFYNDLSSFDIERQKWFPFRVLPPKEGGRDRRRKENDADCTTNVASPGGGLMTKAVVEEDSDGDSELEGGEEDGDRPKGWDLAALRSSMFAFKDGDGNLVFEKMGNEDSGDEVGERTVQRGRELDSEEEMKEEEKESDEEMKEEDKAEEKVPSTQNLTDDEALEATQAVASSEVMKLNDETQEPEAVVRQTPLPRINGKLVVRGNTMYLGGGLLEVGDREVTLDDFWSLDLRRKDKWVCLWPGTMHKQVWRGAVHDDDDSYISTGMEEDDGDESDSMDEASTASKLQTESEELNRIQREIAGINESLTNEPERTPEAGETMADFFSRTLGYWTEQVMANQGNSEEIPAKELKRQGFKLAKERYDELTPLLERLSELKLQKGEKKDHHQARKKEKKAKKKSKKKEF